jgi:uncharacterized protein YqjF (DUF2071 family)
VTRRSNLPVARALAIVLAVATVALGFGLYTTNSKLADSRDAVSSLTQQNHKQAATIDARDAQISALRSNATQLHGTIESCQRTAAVMARTWQLTDQARGWTLKAVEAAAFGDYASAGYYLERSSGPLRQGRGLITGAGDDIKTCIGNAGSGSSGSIS